MKLLLLFTHAPQNLASVVTDWWRGSSGGT